MLVNMGRPIIFNADLLKKRTHGITQTVSLLGRTSQNIMPPQILPLDGSTMCIKSGNRISSGDWRPLALTTLTLNPLSRSSTFRSCSYSVRHPSSRKQHLYRRRPRIPSLMDSPRPAWDTIPLRRYPGSSQSSCYSATLRRNSASTRSRAHSRAPPTSSR